MHQKKLKIKIIKITCSPNNNKYFILAKTNNKIKLVTKFNELKVLKPKNKNL